MKGKILIVDDEPNIVFMLSHRLKQSGYEVASCYRGNDVIPLALKEKIDIIILDLMLPETDGIQICKQLKSNNKLKNIPIIILSAKILSPQEKEKALSMANAYIKKPFKSEKLINIIDKLVSN